MLSGADARRCTDSTATCCRVYTGSVQAWAPSTRSSSAKDAKIIIVNIQKQQILVCVQTFLPLRYMSESCSSRFHVPQRLIEY